MVAVGVHQKPSDRTNDVESGIPLRQPLYNDLNDHPYASIYNTGHSQHSGAELNRASYAPSEWSSECSRAEEEEEKQQSDDSGQITCIILVVVVVIGLAFLLVIAYSNNEGVSSGSNSSTHHSYGHGGSNYMIFHSSHSSSHHSSYHGGRRGGSRGGSRGGGGRRG